VPRQLQRHPEVQQQPGIVGYSTRKLAIDGDRILKFSRGHQLHSVLGFLDERLRLSSEADGHTENQSRNGERRPIGDMPKENIQH